MKRKGFSLIETLITLFIIVIGIVPILSALAFLQDLNIQVYTMGTTYDILNFIGTSIWSKDTQNSSVTVDLPKLMAAYFNQDPNNFKSSYGVSMATSTMIKYELRPNTVISGAYANISGSAPVGEASTTLFLIPAVVSFKNVTAIATFTTKAELHIKPLPNPNISKNNFLVAIDLEANPNNVAFPNGHANDPSTLEGPITSIPTTDFTIYFSLLDANTLYMQTANLPNLNYVRWNLSVIPNDVGHIWIDTKGYNQNIWLQNTTGFDIKYCVNNVEATAANGFSGQIFAP